jgi:hypothetical protein
MCLTDHYDEVSSCYSSSCTSPPLLSWLPCLSHLQGVGKLGCSRRMAAGGNEGLVLPGRNREMRSLMVSLTGKGQASWVYRELRPEPVFPCLACRIECVGESLTVSTVVVAGSFVSQHDPREEEKESVLANKRS